MTQRKPYNPNTKYGRKKLREQAAQNYANMSPEEQSKHDSDKLVFTVVILVIVFLIFLLMGNPGGFLKWASH